MGSMKQYLRPLLFYGGVFFAKILTRRILAKYRLFILLYHKIDYKAPPFFGVAVRPDVFEKQIQFLKRHYKIIDFADLNQFEQLDRTSSSDLIIISFDDITYMDSNAN